MPNKELIAGIIALNPLARGADLRKRLRDACPDAPFGPQYDAYMREVDEAVAIRDCVGDDERLVFGQKPRRFKR